MKKTGEEIIDPNEDPKLRAVLPIQVYNVAARGIVAISCLCVIGIILLSLAGKTNEGLISIASACIGGLVGIFSQRSSSYSK